jgi:hypothetical protein
VVKRRVRAAARLAHQLVVEAHIYGALARKTIIAHCRHHA